jgi:beta-xylosidase
VVRIQVVLAMVVAILVAACGSGSSATVRTLSRGSAALPVLTSAGATPSAGDLGDPSLLTVPRGPTGPARYVLFGTGDWAANVPTATSSDLKHWTPGPDALPVVPRWSHSDLYHSKIWAPTVTAISGHWLMYVVVPDTASGRQCLAVVASDRPEGPYRDAIGHPLVCQRSLGGSIDPSVVKGPGGPVLLWRSVGTCCGSKATIWSQQLSRNGLATVGSAHSLLTPNEAWQTGVVEQPAAVRSSHGGWWLFYSGSSFAEPSYAIGVATCTTLQGPCTNDSTSPLASTRPGQRSPGGLETFRDLHGQLRAVFDTWTRPPGPNGRYDCCRAIDLATLSNL